MQHVAPAIPHAAPTRTERTRGPTYALRRLHSERKCHGCRKQEREDGVSAAQREVEAARAREADELQKAVEV
jgi:hypothetical protein